MTLDSPPPNDRRRRRRLDEEDDAELPQYAPQPMAEDDEAHRFLHPPAPPSSSSMRRRATSEAANGGCGEIVEVQGGHIVRSTGRKDRHSKVCTAKGPRDRRVRLSAHTAIQFYDVQDRLGFDRPSKAVDWLIRKAQTSIDELAQLPPWSPADAIRNAKPRRTAAKTKISPSPPPPQREQLQFGIRKAQRAVEGRVDAHKRQVAPVHAQHVVGKVQEVAQLAVFLQDVRSGAGAVGFLRLLLVFRDELGEFARRR